MANGLPTLCQAAVTHRRRVGSPLALLSAQQVAYGRITTIRRATGGPERVASL